MIHRRQEGDPLRTGFGLYPKGDRYQVGFVAKFGPITFGLRWQRELRRLYVRYGQYTRVLYGRDRHYSLREGNTK